MSVETDLTIPSCCLIPIVKSDRDLFRRPSNRGITLVYDEKENYFVLYGEKSKQKRFARLWYSLLYDIDDEAVRVSCDKFSKVIDDLKSDETVAISLRDNSHEALIQSIIRLGFPVTIYHERQFHEQ